MFKKAVLIITFISLLTSFQFSRAQNAWAAADQNPSALSAADAQAELTSVPVVPTLSAHALAIYRQGLRLGHNPHAFSKIGDGEIAAPWFTTVFDLTPAYYSLGAYSDLKPTIAYFAGSFSRHSQAARAGFNTQSVFNPALADHRVCTSGETPLDCEVRLNRPSFAIVSLGTNQVYAPDMFEAGLRKIIETLISHSVVPILSTKGDNKEGDLRINATVVRLAREYDVPVWNFWLAIQALPDQGLQPDHEHLTWAWSDFGNDWAMQHAWPHRNLTALQTLKAVLEQTQTATGN